LIDFVATGDMLTTNICFGGEDLRTAYITASSSGRLLKTDWPRPGAKLHHLNHERRLEAERIGNAAAELVE
jgi:gluconolactonase